MKQADIAMYQSKKAGRNTLRFFDPEMQTSINTSVALERDLHAAIEKQQFQLYYQIQVDNLGRAIGAEALIRWIHPVRGLVSPADFIPMAEETGLILPIGNWVLETACAQIKAWENNPLSRHLQLAVNVSARQFRQPDFVGQVRKAMESFSINPSRLKLELTESLVLDHVDDAIIKMQELGNIGVRFSMDDFGTGYSSLSYLTQLPLEQLKIDHSFVRNIGVKPSDALIVQAIISMARSLGVDVIAEGVETEDQRSFLAQHGCVLCQGYLFSKPVPLDEFERLLNYY
jgi:EAL domain-containing protein (putative c-di-GMP-specific phosphodiesterase class I)